MPESQATIPRISFTTKIIFGALLGLFCGIMLGPHCIWFKWLGDAYVGLLQMTVLPYVTVSLVGHVGRLSLLDGQRLAMAAIRVLLFLWGLGLLVTVMMSWSFPVWNSGSFFSTTLTAEPESINWITLFVPANPFASLSENLVPAVVVFSLGLGVAVTGVPNKERLLDQLDIIMEGLSRLNKIVVRLSPLGLFGVVAYAAGTMTLHQFGLLQGYLLTYAAASVLLVFAVLPLLVSAFTPFTARQVLSVSRDALITAFIVGNTFVVMPMVIEAARRLFATREGKRWANSHQPEFIIPLAYPFPDLGRVVGLVFIPFAAWFYGMRIDVENYPELFAVGMLGAFAKPVVTVPLLLQIAEIPSDIFNLYLSVGVIASRLGDLMKAMHLLCFAVLTSAILSGQFRIQHRRLLLAGTGSLLALVLAILGIRTFLSEVFADSFSRENLVVAREPLFRMTGGKVLGKGEPSRVPLDAGESTLARIQRCGEIRVGFDRDQLPFSYFNRAGKLVGYDIEVAYRLAKDLGVRPVFVPIDSDVLSGFESDHFDIAMSALEGSVKRASNLSHPPPYMQVTIGLLCLDHNQRFVRNVADIKDNRYLQFAVVRESLTEELIQEALPRHRIRVLDSEKEFFDPGVADVLVTNLETASAWTVQFPQFSVVKPEGLDLQIPLYYYSHPRDNSIEEFLESWQLIRKPWFDQLKEYWIYGKDPPEEQGRWYLLRSVLERDSPSGDESAE